MNYFIEGREQIKSIVINGNTLEGDLEFQNSIKINCNFRGTIKGNGLLFIDKDASVNAEILVNELIIAGNFDGSIIAKSKVEIDETAVVRGNIDTYKLKVADGAILEATCNMHSQEKIDEIIKNKYNTAIEPKKVIENEETKEEVKEKIIKKEKKIK